MYIVQKPFWALLQTKLAQIFYGGCTDKCLKLDNKSESSSTTEAVQNKEHSSSYSAENILPNTWCLLLKAIT